MSIIDIPNEIWTQILPHLSSDDFCNLKCSCKHFYQIFQDIYLHKFVKKKYRFTLNTNSSDVFSDIEYDCHTKTEFWKRLDNDIMFWYVNRKIFKKILKSDTYLGHRVHTFFRELQTTRSPGYYNIENSTYLMFERMWKKAILPNFRMEESLAKIDYTITVDGKKLPKKEITFTSHLST